MDNAMVMAGRAVSRRLLVRMVAVAVSVSAAFAVVMALFQRGAEAQFQGTFRQIICPILINLSDAFSGIFGGLLAGLFSSLLSFFSCGIS